MFTNHKSLKVVVPQKLRFRPPYCANSQCRWHQPETCQREGVFIRYGIRKISRYPYISVRFRCQRCRKTFSDSFFGFSYRDQLDANYKEINFLKGGFSRRRISRELGCSLDTVLRRCRKIAAQSLLVQAKMMAGLKIQESVAYDGVENFSFSQYDPNNINHVVGRESYFVYDFNFSPLNRKGRTSPRQKRRMKDLDQKFGRYDGKEIQKATRRLLSRLLTRTEGELVFHSDNHFAYRRAIQSLPERDRICHLITSSKLARNFRNRLFAINHLDILTRQNSTTFKRETIAFSKHSIGMVEDFAMLMTDKNFMKPIFSKKHKQDPSTNIESPAMRVGIAKKILSFYELFSVRVTKAQVNLSEDWKMFVERVDPTSRRKIRNYAGI
jgi:transposase-like protein